MRKRRYAGPVADRVMGLLGTISFDLSLYEHEALDENERLEWEGAVLELAEIIKARRMIELMAEIQAKKDGTQ